MHNGYKAMTIACWPSASGAKNEEILIPKFPCSCIMNIRKDHDSYSCHISTIIRKILGTQVPHITIVETMDSGDQERIQSSCNDYHQSSEGMMAEPGIKPANFCKIS